MKRISISNAAHNVWEIEIWRKKNIFTHQLIRLISIHSHVQIFNHLQFSWTFYGIILQLSNHFSNGKHTHTLQQNTTRNQWKRYKVYKCIYVFVHCLFKVECIRYGHTMISISNIHSLLQFHSHQSFVGRRFISNPSKYALKQWELNWSEIWWMLRVSALDSPNQWETEYQASECDRHNAKYQR